MSGEQFPAGAGVRRGYCDGVYCFTKREKSDVLPVRLGPSWRKAIDMHLCASCLADFVAAGTVIESAHLYALAIDGLYREVKGDITTELVDE